MFSHNRSDQHSVPEEGGAGAAAAVSGKKSRSLKPLAVLLPYVLRNRAMVFAALAALLVSAAATLAVPIGVRRMLDMGFGASSSGDINNYFIFMLTIGIVLAFASGARFYFVNWVGERVVADLRVDVFTHLLRLSPAFYEKTHSGEVMSRLTADTTLIKTAVGSGASQALRNFILMLGAVVMMFVTSIKLSLLVLLAIPAIVVPLVIYGRAVRKLSRQAQDTLANSASYAGENLSAIRTMQAFTHENEVIRRFTEAVDLSFTSAKARLKARSGLTAIAILMVFTSIIAVLWFGAQAVLSGEISGGLLGQFVLYAVISGTSMGALSEVWGEIQQVIGASERMTELMAITPEIITPPTPEPLPASGGGEIVFDKVSFTYPSRPDIKALNEVTFSISAGDNIAIVGPSGAGKSTIFSLLMRFYDPEEGSIKLDGVNVAAADITDLRQHMAIVPQDVALFADTVFENIRYGSPDASIDDVISAAKSAFADEFIRKLPQGYETSLGERGVTLSGGQRQRIAIARAILRNAPVLLLDEATSSLDSRSEKLVHDALENLKHNRTTLTIAHRLSTVQKADRIMVMQDGQIVESGEHDAMIAANGPYARLANLQLRN